MSKPKVICPDCGAEMNQHAVKIDYGVDDPKFVDAVFGGALKERWGLLEKMLRGEDL